jgi:hypothetical protein
MGVTAGIFLASILLKEMRYLVYIRYLRFYPTLTQLGFSIFSVRQSCVKKFEDFEGRLIVASEAPSELSGAGSTKAT